MSGVGEISSIHDQESRAQRASPSVVPLYWDCGKPLTASFREGLKAFYARTPFHLAGREGRDVDQLLRNAAENSGADWAAVIAVGNVFSNQGLLVSEIETFLSSLGEEVLVCGHLIDRRAQYCGLHEQFFLVNLAIYRRLGMPAFGDYRQGRKPLQGYVAGESVHDDYTPRWLRPEGGVSERETGICGWGLVDASLRAGLGVLNLSDELRRTKLFVYPNDESEKLNRNLELIEQLEDLDNGSQRAVLAHLVLKRLNLIPSSDAGSLSFRERGNTVFFFNTEPLLPHVGWRPSAGEPIDVYAGPCSGFQDLAFCRLAGVHDGTEIVYFDLNDAALEMKKHVLASFDGDPHELAAVIEDLRRKFPREDLHVGDFARKLSELLAVFDGDERAFREFWRRFSGLKKSFVKLDLLSQHRKLLSLLGRERRGILNVSDIYLGQNEIVRGMHQMRELLRRLRDDGREYPELSLTGANLELERFFAKARDLRLKGDA